MKILFLLATSSLLMALGTQNVAAQEDKLLDGLTPETYQSVLAENTDNAILNATPTINSTTVGSSDLQLDSGFFENAPIAVPGAVDTSFAGVRFRLSIEGR